MSAVDVSEVREVALALTDTRNSIVRIGDNYLASAFDPEALEASMRPDREAVAALNQAIDYLADYAAIHDDFGASA